MIPLQNGKEKNSGHSGFGPEQLSRMEILFSEVRLQEEWVQGGSQSSGFGVPTRQLSRKLSK